MHIHGHVPASTHQPDPNVMYPGLGPDAKILINTTFALTTVGQFALLLLGATLLLSRRVYKRGVVLGNLLVVTFASTIAPYLLMYGGAIWIPDPPAGLCITQAALMDGTGTMLSVASLAVVMDIMMELKLLRPRILGGRNCRGILVTAPYIVFLVFSSSSAALGITHREEVKHVPNDLACSLNHPSFAITMQIIVVLALVTTLCLEVYAIIHAIRRTQRYKYPDPRPAILSFSQAVRIVFFTCLQAFLLVVTALNAYVESPALHIASILYQALMPLSTFLIFGITEDCISEWKSWMTLSRFRRDRKHSHLHVQVTVESEKY